jgi:predicted glycosyltransferase
MSKRFGNKAIVLRQVVDGVKLLQNIDIFVGAGGTMTAESALLGKPTISIAPIKFYVDDYLRKVGLVVQASNPTQIDKLLKSFLEDERECILIQNRAARILNKMEDPIEKLVTYVSTIDKT